MNLQETSLKRRGVRLATGAYLLFCVLAGLWWLLPTFRHFHLVLANDAPWDLEVDWRTARAFIDGYNPFTHAGGLRAGLSQLGPAGHGHPPSTSFWFIPLAYFNLRTATVVLGWLLALSFLIEMIAVVRELRWPFPFATGWLLGCFFLSYELFAYHFSLGQSSQAIGLAFVLAWLCLRRRRDWLAGLALGFACSLKAFPAIAVLTLLVYRRWRAVAAAVALYVTISIYMTAHFGVHSWVFFLEKQKPVANQWMSSIHNQSIHGIVLRLFEPVCTGGGPTLKLATLISSLIGLLLIGAMGWACFKAWRRGLPIDLPFLGFVVLSVFVSQWAWEHYSAILFPAILVAAHHTVRSLRQGASFWFIGANGALLLGSLATLSIPRPEKVWLLFAYQAGFKSAHFRLHVFEVLNWIHLPMLIAVFGSLLWWNVRLRRWNGPSGVSMARLS